MNDEPTSLGSLRPTGPQQHRIKPLKVRQFHIVGGGCFGTQYTRCLKRAQGLGWLKFQKINIIDLDSQCGAIQEALIGEDVQLIQQDWIEYFSHQLIRSFGLQGHNQDHWVPSPLSPHILFLGFQKAAAILQEGLGFKRAPFMEETPTPVRMNLKAGTQALSFAKWRCPTNCIEPSPCPAIQKKRDWDMKQTLLDFLTQDSRSRSSHVLQCQHLIHGVGTIPMAGIFQEFGKMMAAFQDPRVQEMLVATVSGCHGIIGKAVRKG